MVHAEGSFEHGIELGVRLGNLELANPIMPASGCFGPELGRIVPLDTLGAVVTKTVFRARRAGNRAHRLSETPASMLNSIGIPSPGIERFRSEVLPRYRDIGVPVIVSIGGLALEDYWELTDDLEAEQIEALEVNVSCPNLEKGGLTIGANPDQVGTVVTGVAQRTALPVICKLTPNVTSIAEAAIASEQAGAAALTVANTFVGLAIDHRTRRPILGNGIGGLSGPAVKPLALRLVWEASRAVRIPIVGCGGVSSTRDVIEFLLAGASAVQVGTATFSQPDVMVRIVDELPAALAEVGVSKASELVGKLLMSEELAV